MADKSHNYELAFHINPDVDDAKLAEIRQNLEKEVTDIGAVITFAKEPEKIHLSYEIKHSRFSYFGYFHFTLPNTENIATLESQLKLIPELLRHLILKLPSDAAKKKAQARQYKPREVRIEKKPVAPKATEEETKKMEEKLEDIIEKL